MTVYKKRPTIKINKDAVIEGKVDIRNRINEVLSFQEKESAVLIIECYPGVNEEALKEQIVDYLAVNKVIHSKEYYVPSEEVTNRITDTLTDDEVFGVMSHYRYDDFIDKSKCLKLQKEIEISKDHVVIYGVGAAALVKDYDVLLYVDLPRWEIQLRHRKGMPNWKADNRTASAKQKYKRGYFFEWRTADRLKQELYQDIDFLLDSTDHTSLKMISGDHYRSALKTAAVRPFRVVPYFDSSVWGGQWMKQKFDLDKKFVNYGWAFDGVPEENSLLLQFGQKVIEIPAINLVFAEPESVLGERVQARYGKEFPIRFDYLDTVDGGNLSLQVHPTVHYVYDRFGMKYTQDESYYILDATEASYIYLGLKNNVDTKAMIQDLKKADADLNYSFPAEKYINKIPVKKHDHYSIPAGTIHCSGPDTVVLEISSTPNIFTFKLWDWDRVGLDGKPRPIHIEHGERNIQFNRDYDWVKENLIHSYTPPQKIENFSEETGLHRLEPIKTERHWFNKKIRVENHDSVSVCNLVEGEEIIVRSLEGKFEELIFHYGETFIIPASITAFEVVNNGSKKEKVALLQAYVR